MAWLVAISSILAAFPSPSHAATSDTQAVLEVAVDDGKVDFGDVSPVSSPYTARDAVYIAVKTWGTSTWNLTMNATRDFSAGDGGPTFPISNLEVAARLNGEPAPFRKCSTSPVALISNGPVVGGIVVMDYRLNVGYDVPPVAPGARYGSELVYTTSYGHVAASFVDPNPFNPYTDGAVRVKYRYIASSSSLYFRIYNSAGILVYSRSLPKPAEGWHEETWDGKKTDGSIVPDGTYSYYVTTSIYALAGGYIQVQTTPAPAAPRDDGTGPRGMAIELSTRAEPATASVGDILTYSASIRNTSTFALENGHVSFSLPNGIRLVPGTDYIDGRHSLGTGTGTGTSWRLGRLASGSTVSVSFKALVGPDARPGAATGYARVTGTVGTVAVSSAEAKVLVYIRDQIAAAFGTVAGAVFVDENGNGKMDAGEQPVKGVVLTLDSTEAAKSDSGGRFVLDRLAAGDYVLAVAAKSLPPGHRPRSPVILVSVAEGETVRFDIPLERPTKEPGGQSPQGFLVGTGILKLEASPGHTSWDAQGNIAGGMRNGPDLTLTARLGPTSSLMGRVGFTAQLARTARFVASVSQDISSDGRHPVLDVRVEAAPMPHLTLTAGYEGSRGASWMSGEYEHCLTDALTLTASLRLSPQASPAPDEGHSTDHDPGRVVIVPQASLTYSGASGVTGRLSFGGASPPAAEAACALPLGSRLRLSIVHRWNELAPPTTLIGLNYTGGGSFALGAEYQPGHQRLQGTLRLAARISPGDPYRADLRASFEPRRQDISLKLSLRFQGFRDAAVSLAQGFESRETTSGTRVATSSIVFAGSLRLSEHVTASASWSMKQADEISAGSSAHALTRGVAIHLDRRVTSRVSLGAGAMWASQDPGGVSLVTLDLMAAYDVTSRARLVVGYRSMPGATGSPPAEAPWPVGPYVRLLLALGGEFAASGLRSVR
ncbi:MAG: FlgD immunoglobulin-like domain containing protein [Bacillota bacterium]